jgi:hypothetical protein
MGDHRFDPPLVIDVRCRWCGQGLAVTSQHWGSGLVIEGLDDLSFIHEDGNPECIQTYHAQPFDGWGATRKFRVALERYYLARDEASDD